MDNSIAFQSIELEGNEEIVDFSIAETKVTQLICRHPRCNLKLANISSRLSHERNQHSQKTFTCGKCNFVAERKESIESHKLWMHHGLKANKLSRLFVIYVICYFSLNNKYFHFTEMLKC
jgi:hypothetical protein